MKRLLLDGCLCKHDPSLVSTQIGEHLWHFKRAANLGQQYVLCIVIEDTYNFQTYMYLEKPERKDKKY